MLHQCTIGDMDDFMPVWQSTETAPKPGFEIWFAVVLVPQERQALWLRYTQFIPQAEQRGAYPARNLLWAAYFNAHKPEKHCWGTTQVSEVSWQGETGHWETGLGERALLSPERLRGEVPTPLGALSWDLNFTSRFETHSPLPEWLLRSPWAQRPKTQSRVCAPFAQVQGQMTLHGVSQHWPQTTAAKGILQHLWGRQRVPELYWTYVPAFDDQPDWGLEIVAVRPEPHGPFLLFVSLRQGTELWHESRLWRALRGRVEVDYPRLRFRAHCHDFDVQVESWLDPQQSPPYLYRDPEGSARYVEQCDLGSAHCELRRGRWRQSLRSHCGAAVEFHALHPWRAQAYWDPFAANPPSS